MLVSQKVHVFKRQTDHDGTSLLAAAATAGSQLKSAYYCARRQYIIYLILLESMLRTSAIHEAPFTMQLAMRLFSASGHSRCHFNIM